MMEEGDPQRKFPVWIIEHLWAHGMMNLEEVVDPSRWPDVDSQPLSLRDSWRLRVASAQVYSIVKIRDTRNFEKALSFLETTHKLLPGLVSAIKHMKIVFGLKTMVVMWMLKEGRGMLEVVTKVMQFFPNKLPQYRDQCSQQEMFLMRKNHLDFRSLAQSLAMDKTILEDYIKNQMQRQYGERYAQKVEDRLLHYLLVLESELPRETHIDKIMNKQSPVTEEEKLLLKVITSNSAEIAKTLKTLLHCDVTSCQAGTSPFSARSKRKNISDLAAEPSVPRISPETAPTLIGKKSPGQRLSGVSQSVEEPVCDPIACGEAADTPVSEPQRAVVDGCRRSGSAQFCSKHQRWVTNILRECPGSCLEELQLHVKDSLSPLLFHSSSSSQDLTPSGLTTGPTAQQTTRLSTPPQATLQAPELLTDAAAAAEAAAAAANESPVAPIPSMVQPLPPLMTSVVQLTDTAAVKSICSDPTLPVPSDPVTEEKQSRLISTVQPLRSSQRSPDTASKHDSDSPGIPLPPARTFSKRSTRFRRSQALTPSPEEQLLKNSDPVSSPHSHGSSALSSPVSKSHSSSSICHLQLSSDRSSSPMTRRKSIRLQTKRINRFPSSSDENSPIPFISSKAKVQRVQSDPHLQSERLQPFVVLTRLSTEECVRAITPRREESMTQVEGVKSKETSDDSDSSCDVYGLYSTDSSDSEGEDSLHRDPDYKPHINKRRLILEYESARILNGQ